jgi:hypothetical protein
VELVKITLKITVDVFSGKENPYVELGADVSREILDRLKPSRKLIKEELKRPPESSLGYRGLVFELVDMSSREFPKTFRLINGDLFGDDLAHRAADENFEDFFCGDKGPIRKLKAERGFPELVRGEMMRYLRDRSKYVYQPGTWPINGTCECAPLYEPTWWNNPLRQPYNNCYNYATNYRTDTFAQPGKAAGAMYTALTCASVKPAAVADCLIDSPNANNQCPNEGHLAALVIWPNSDFHWYRKGRNGNWTHKPGGGAVTNLDNSGHIITDPRTANRGPYTVFCTFMVVMHGHIKIK